MLFQVWSVGRLSPQCRRRSFRNACRERLAVVVADHVVHEDDAAQLGPADAALLDLRIDPPVLPVPVRAEQARDLADRLGRPIQVAAEREPRERLQDDLLDRVTVALDLAVDLRAQRRLREHRPEAERDEQSARGGAPARSRQASAVAGAWKSAP